MNSNENKVYKDLIQLNIDSSKGYRVAAENTTYPRLQTFFDENSIEREAHVKKLTDQSGIPGTDPSFKAELHQFWANLKTSKKQFDGSAVIEECIRGDKHLLKQYEKYSGLSDIPDELKQTIESQKKDVENTYGQLLDYKKEYAEMDKGRHRETPV